jgi:hypothetical protein
VVSSALPVSVISAAIGGFHIRPDLQTYQTTPGHDTTIRPSADIPLRFILHDPAPLSRPVMPPRLPLRAPRAPLPRNAARVHIPPIRRFASTSSDAPEVYDVVCVGGGPAGLSLLAGLKASPVTSGLRVALIEGQKDASLEIFSNRCSSLTPASVKNLQGTSSRFSWRTLI